MSGSCKKNRNKCFQWPRDWRLGSKQRGFGSLMGTSLTQEVVPSAMAPGHWGNGKGSDLCRLLRSKGEQGCAGNDAAISLHHCEVGQLAHQLHRVERDGGTHKQPG